MYVTVFELNKRDERTLESLRNRNEMHRDVQAMCAAGGFPGKCVYRVTERNSKLMLYIYSAEPVNKEKAHFGMKFLGEGEVPKRKTGEIIWIDVLATPTKTIWDDGKKKKRGIKTAEERLDWCRKRAEENGFKPRRIFEGNREELRVDKHRSAAWAATAYEYRIEAEITDEDAFMDCMLKGFGRNGSYGAGMMFIAK